MILLYVFLAIPVLLATLIATIILMNIRVKLANYVNIVYKCQCLDTRLQNKG
jgi:hypothetical protein